MHNPNALMSTKLATMTPMATLAPVPRPRPAVDDRTWIGAQGERGEFFVGEGFADAGEIVHYSSSFRVLTVQLNARECHRDLVYSLMSRRPASRNF